MSIDARIIDASTERTVKVNQGGVLAVGPSHTSLPFNATAGTDDVVVNVVPAKADHVFCITGIFLTSNKNVDPNTAATVNVFTGAASDTTLANADQVLLTLPIAKDTTRDINPILLEAAEGTYVNLVTSDDDIFATVMGYYLKVEG